MENNNNTCRCVSCRTHPDHAQRHTQLGLEPARREVTCWTPGNVQSGGLAASTRGVINAAVECGAKVECRECPICRPIPEWAKKAFDLPPAVDDSYPIAVEISMSVSADAGAVRAALAAGGDELKKLVLPLVHEHLELDGENDITRAEITT